MPRKKSVLKKVPTKRAKVKTRSRDKKSLPPEPLKAVTVTMVVQGYSEPRKTSPNWVQFANGGVQSFEVPLPKGILRVITAFPVVKDHHADIPDATMRWWKPVALDLEFIAKPHLTVSNARLAGTWTGYFGVAFDESTNKVTVGGSPQAKGNWPIDVMVLYQ